MTRRPFSYLTSALLVLAIFALLQPAARDGEQEAATAAASTTHYSQSVSDSQEVDSQMVSLLPPPPVTPQLADLELVGASIANYDR